MKKKTWFVTPLIITLIIIIFIISLMSMFFEGVQLTIIQFTIGLITAAAIFWRTENIKRDIRRCLKQLAHKMSNHDREGLDRFPMPAIAFSKYGEILWYNDIFQNAVLSGEEMTGGKISSLFKSFDINDIPENGQIEVSHANKKYTMFVSETNIGGKVKYVAYFIDNTSLKSIANEYKQSRQVAIFVLFDNQDEIFKQLKESEKIQVRGSVDEIIRNWVEETTGFIEYLENGKYLIMVEMRHIQKMIERKFAILDAARKIKVDGRNYVTLSIGVGMGAGNFKESINWANQALDMCLGRGGDQAAVKSRDGYIFFGGVSKAIERSSKVRTRVLSLAFAELIKNSDMVYVMGHKRSDLDAMGACIGIHALSKYYDRPSKIVYNPKTTMAGQLVDNYIKHSGKSAFMTVEDALERDVEKSLLIVVDTHSPDFVESKEFYQMFENVIVIDHHRKMVNHIDNTLIFFHEPYASSACEMVAELIQCVDEKCIDRLEAESLLAGIMLDTKNFVIRTGVRTFEASAYLRRRGAETVEIKRFFADTMSTYIEKSQIVATAEIHNNCAIAVADENYDNVRIASVQAADELLSIQGVFASFVIYDIDGTINVSARSFGKFNVQIIMETLGGGGHATMAAAQIKGSDVNTVRKTLIELLNSDFSE